MAFYYLDLLAQAEKSNWIPGRVMVKFKYDEAELPEGKVESDFARVDIRSAALKEALQRFGVSRFARVVSNAVRGDTLRTLPDGRQIKLTDFSQLYLLTFPETIPVDSVIAVLQRRDEVIYVEPDQYNIYDVEPNDEFFDDQWHLKQSSDEDIDAPEAWDLNKGDGVKIAIHDTGVRTTHEDLISKREGGETSFSSTHGTMVAGVAAAATNNTDGVAGVAWNSKFIPYDNQGTVSGDVADINAAVSAGADIINMSWSLPSYAQSLKDALDNAFA